MTLKLKLVILAISLLFSFGSAWFIQSWRYDLKLTKQELDYLDAQRIVQEKHREALITQQNISDKEHERYKKDVNDLQKLFDKAIADNSKHVVVIDGLRKQQEDLRTRIDTVSDEALRKYAVESSRALTEISDALREEQLAHQDTSRKADEYYSAWKALDSSWPK